MKHNMPSYAVENGIKERIYRREYVTMEEVKADMFRYIELFYNRKRLHSVLGYMSPVEYRLKYDGSQVAENKGLKMRMVSEGSS